jgi:probable rRNA maturation factor
MINISILESVRMSNLTEMVEKTSETALRFQKVDLKTVDLTIVITGDAEIKKLNQQFLDIDAPTDVLSFPSDEIDPDTHNRYLGDIIISYPRADAQASARNGTTQSELQLLITHGILHLLGFDHADETQKEEMWTLQKQILAILGVDISNPI